MKGVVENYPLAELTTWKVGGVAEYFATPNDIDQLKSLLLWARDIKQDTHVLGHGSNVLISDLGVSGLVIHMGKLNQVYRSGVDGSNFEFYAQAGTGKAEALKAFLKANLSPAVFLAGLPGDLGGGVVMNAGVGTDQTPKEFCEIVKSVDVLQWSDGRFVEKHISGSALQWSYRSSKGWQPGVITGVHLEWPNEVDTSVLKRVREGNARRKATQPLTMPSCGSVFKNPEGHHSGALIEQAGLKGFAIGGAQVSEKHGNFIVNTGNATALEIHQVMVHVQNKIKDTFGITLTNEVAYLGDWESKSSMGSSL